ncbi:MAG TPA: hypothetical protein DIT13_16475 [Verrucomicrobiales bacterium]|nr:hypothetical protein [Verrucomicrobiales bacterium]
MAALKPGGRPRAGLDRVLDALFYRLRNADPWRDLPGSEQIQQQARQEALPSALPGVENFFRRLKSWACAGTRRASSPVTCSASSSSLPSSAGSGAAAEGFQTRPSALAAIWDTAPAAVCGIRRLFRAGRLCRGRGRLCRGLPE